MTQEVKKEIVSWVLFLLSAVACAFVINKFIIFNAYVPSESMESTIMAGDRVLGLRLTYTFGKPERGDVAIFIFPDDGKTYYVKRVWGLPGDKIEIKKGKIYINDSETPADDPHVNEPPFENDYGPYYVPEGHYFMLGDNRNNSADSRAWVNKFVAEDKILAKAYVRLWPKPTIIK